ncbi:MAG: hypothetical protein LBG21_04565 [Campylobacteraceae bacterium]|jgi:hypothetical protein|nr:hypothetical protein [Campylobacteraceae bacterium]
MKRFVLLILSILVLSGCGAKNDVQNDLYNNQTYYQDENLTEYGQNNVSNASHVQQICNQDKNLTVTVYEQNNELNGEDITSQRSMIKDVLSTLGVIITVFIDIGLFIVPLIIQFS